MSPPDKTSSDISLCIEHVLARYFADLDGEKPADVYDMVVRQVERPMLVLVMAQARGNQTVAAEILGMNRSTLRRKLTDHGLL